MHQTTSRTPRRSTCLNSGAGREPDRARSLRAPAGAAAESLERRLCLSATFTAAPGAPVAVGANPHVVALADFNGDGTPDLAVPDANDNTLSVLLGNGSGGFTAAAKSPVSVGAGPVTAAAGDFNRDGKPDLAVADFSDNTVTVLLGNGDGTFTAAPGSPVTVASGPSNVTVGDFNGDGNPDLAVPAFSGNTVSVLLGNGSGTFTAAPPGSPFTVGAQPFSLTTGDFNGDGKADLAVANFAGNSLSVLLGNGSGGFAAAPGSPVAVGAGPYASAAGDFNGDHKADLAVANFNDNTVTVLLGNGDGSFTPAPASPFAVGVNPYSVAAADFNGDGKADLATADNGGNGVSVLFGNGNGTFTAAPDSPLAVGKGPVSLSLGDFNKDTRPDLVVSNAGDNTLSVLLDTSGPPTPLPSGTAGASLSASLPASVVGGVKTRASAFVTVNAPASAALSGPVTVTLYASSGQTLDNATPLAAPVTQKLRLKAGARKALRLKLSAFPTTLQGTYTLIAAVNAPDGTTTAVAGPSLTIARPLVSIRTSNLAGSPASVAPGKKATLSLTLQNAGNVPAAAAVPLTLSLCTSPSGTGGQAVATTSLRVKLNAGQSKAYRVRFAVPAGTTAGSYYLAASLSVSALGDTAAAHGVAVSGAPINVT